MLADFLTVFRKEWLEVGDQFTRFRRGGWSVLLVIAFLGIFIPLQFGPGWAASPAMFFYWAFMTASMTSTIVADAIAGERERHTLETLLATRLPDAAILLGKVAAAVSYGCAFTLVNILIGLATVAIAYGDDATLMSPRRMLVVAGLTAGSALLVAGIGLLVSVRTATVRQAQQLFGVFFLLATMVPVIIWTLLDEHRQAAFLGWSETAGVDGVAWRAGGSMALVGVLLVATGIARFRRGTRMLEE